MHRRTYQHNYGVAAILGIVSAIGFASLLPSPTVSAYTDPSLSFVNISLVDEGTLGTTGRDHILKATSTSNAFSTIKSAVDIDVYGSEDFSIFLRSSNELEYNATRPSNYIWRDDVDYGTRSANLIGNNPANTITPLSTTDITSTGTSLDNFKSLSTSAWGYRWTFDQYDDNDIPAPSTVGSTITRPALAQTLSSDYYGIKSDGLETKLSNPTTMSNTDPSKQGVYTTNIDKNASGRLLLEFGANVTPDLPADTYTGYVAVSVVATPSKITLLSPLLTDMQQMTPEICADTPTPKGPNDGTAATETITNRYATYSDASPYSYTLSTESNPDKFYIGHQDTTTGEISYTETAVATYDSIKATYDNNHNISANKSSYVPETTLIDNRDNKAYLVRKLADGNCWMSQNLEFDFLMSNGGYAITNSANQTYIQDGEGNWYYTGNEASDSIVVTPGDDYHARNLIRHKELTQLSPSNTDVRSDWTPLSYRTEYSEAKVYTTMMSTLIDSDYPQYGWNDNGSDGMRSYSFWKSNANWAFYDPDADTATNPNKGASTGSPYNRRGNLYNFTAATLGSLTNTNNTGEAPSSICPAGWQLPVNGDSDNTLKSFRNLLRKNYGLTATGGGEAGMNDFAKTQESPLNFMRSGYYRRAFGGVRSMTNDGYWWSSTTDSSTQARNLLTVTGHVLTENNNLRGAGFSVRCVAK